MYRKAKILAIERGISLRTLVIDALASHMDAPDALGESISRGGFFAQRKL
jgi:hypothetical protein